MTLLFIAGLKISEILIIALIIVLLFGAKKIPELMQGIGRGVRNFKEEVKKISDDAQNDKL